MHAILLFMDYHTAKAPSLQRPSHYLVKPSLRHRSTCNTASKSRKGKTFIPQRSVTSVENILSNHSQRFGFSQGQSPSQIRGKGSSGLFTTLTTHTCVCLHCLAIKLAKVIKNLSS